MPRGSTNGAVAAIARLSELLNVPNLSGSGVDTAAGAVPHPGAFLPEPETRGLSPEMARVLYALLKLAPNLRQRLGLVSTEPSPSSWMATLQAPGYDERTGWHNQIQGEADPEGAIWLSPTAQTETGNSLGSVEPGPLLAHEAGHLVNIGHDTKPNSLDLEKLALLARLGKSR